VGNVYEQEVEGMTMTIKTGLQLQARELEMCQWPDINPTAHGSIQTSDGNISLHVATSGKAQHKSKNHTLLT
jgi:hypothetical protein